jgi:hypothetical protein
MLELLGLRPGTFVCVAAALIMGKIFFPFLCFISLFSGFDPLYPGRLTERNGIRQ